MGVEAVVQEFALGRQQLAEESRRVAAAIQDGLSGAPSPFQMIPSFIGLPDGQETGEFLALDFGGSNLRVGRVALAGGRIKTLALREWPLQELMPGQAGQAEELFRRIAQEISDLAGSSGGLLGHTFSYPVRQSGINEAVLENWTKEVAFTGAGEVDVNGLLRQQLVAAGRPDIIPAAVLNDTVAVLLAAAYQHGCRDIVGSICGTGHNSCYYEETRKMVINLEAGNFAPACRNRFDQAVDLESAQPGRQLLEKMTAGNYLAKLAAQAATELGIKERPATARELSALVAEGTHPLHSVACAIVRRAAALVAAEYCGIAAYLAKDGGRLGKIAIDGSVYNKISLFKQELAETLPLLSDDPPQAIPSDNSSLYGAAVACAVLSARR